MGRGLEFKLNRTAIASNVVAGTDWVAVQLYSQQTKPIYIDGINWALRSTVSTDYGLILFNDLRVLRGARLTDTSLTIANILALNTEEVYHSSRSNQQWGVYDSFAYPWIVEPGNSYIFLNGDMATSGAFTGAVSLFLTVQGRIMPDWESEHIRYEARDAAKLPDLGDTDVKKS